MKHNKIKPKQRILETATRLFYKQGYHSTGINQIVAESGVAKSSLYQHFHAKEELAATCLQERHKYWFYELKTFILSANSRKNKVLVLFDFLYYMNEKENYLGCAFINILSETHYVSQKIMSCIMDHKIEVRTLFKDLLLGTNLHPDHLYLLFESAMIESKLYRNQWPVNSAKSIVNSLLN
ncbi:TetR/AcrR family transcriptional regulator [Pedobacter sp. V48]|uniref:TetR/AcrR family transcriptional regulator n=1 Tax=Pedobacter sp. V48 TaxID=509635 RepID=UPI0003E49DC3|nr:TetR/AcrR family transcriptional regulator [Pedobacter sp. V48]ETZ21001.1 hypothetical protein N824_02490 [Pedobacter sp. V48]